MKLTFITMLKVRYLSLKNSTPALGYWDMTFLDDLLDGMPDSDRQVVVIPGAYQGDIIPQINEYLKQFPKVLVFITSDEEGKFDCTQLEHPDILHYRQYGYCDPDHVFPIGYTPDTRPTLKKIGLVEKDITCFFAGQLNSQERREMFARLAEVPKSVLFGTDGFSKGLPQKEYYDYLAHSIFAPSPGGHVSPDSFRFYEALEAGCFPTDFPRYMTEMFPDIVMNKSNSQMFAWWIRKKLELKQKLRQDLDINYAMTVVVPTSPIPSHPSTEIIEQTIKSIRHHTAMDIIITIDGIRPEQENMRNDYTEYVRRLLWKCNFEWENVMPIIFPTHVHQSGMMREALNYVKTPLLLYVEHDTPLVTDEEIEWGLISEMMLDKTMNVVRFHYEAQIPPEHQYLMLSKIGDKFLQTKQWSQRPHMARTDFYRDMMQYFSPESNCFIEDRIYSKCVEGNPDDWKVYIYTPTFKNIKRSLNLDGRAGDRKFDKEGEQIW